MLVICRRTALIWIKTSRRYGNTVKFVRYAVLSFGDGILWMSNRDPEADCKSGMVKIGGPGSRFLERLT